MRVSDIKYVKVRAGVRYWEDSYYNGEEDVSLYYTKEPISPNMPFAVSRGRGSIASPFEAYDWVITIDPHNGKIFGWKDGDYARIHYKTCDDNTIWLIGHNDEVLGEYKCYVPDFLSPKESGYGDYIIFDVEENGHINGFKFTDSDIQNLIDSAF